MGKKKVTQDETPEVRMASGYVEKFWDMIKISEIEGEIHLVAKETEEDGFDPVKVKTEMIDDIKEWIQHYNVLDIVKKMIEDKLDSMKEDILIVLNAIECSQIGGYKITVIPASKSLDGDKVKKYMSENGISIDDFMNPKSGLQKFERSQDITTIFLKPAPKNE